MHALNAQVTLGPGLICWTNAIVVVGAETWDRGDALGGSAVNHLVFSLERFKTTPNEDWRILSSQCNARSGEVPEPPFFCRPNGAHTQIEVWTSR